MTSDDIHETEYHIDVPERGQVSAILTMPATPDSMIVLGHGAGAGMRHHFMQSLSERLAAQGMASFRYQFPYMEGGGRRPDAARILWATIERAVAVAANIGPNLPLFAGGKSMGGRMTSHTATKGRLGRVRGLIFFGFPLHAPGKPGCERAEHLPLVGLPMLFLQGTRDTLALTELIQPVCEALGELASLHMVEGADHSFAVLKRSGRNPEEVWDELIGQTRAWVTQHSA